MRRRGKTTVPFQITTRSAAKSLVTPVTGEIHSGLTDPEARIATPSPRLSTAAQLLTAMDQQTQQTAALVTALNALPAAAPAAGAGGPAAAVMPRISATAVESIPRFEGGSHTAHLVPQDLPRYS
ncbi:uncharacterized protein LOC123469951 [Daphnia magna]|uniref:uncharacterized protein LOC123469951 n=1 Tax=Daphnia magna TaxID=35525 RepID=UPI001E1BD91F|nr:uncharacterized protein LOC123469951 [Daphnia magna]